MCIQTVIENWFEDANWRQQHIEKYGHLNVFKKIVCRERKRHHLKWLRYHNFDQCVNIVSDFNVPSCLYTQILNNNMTYKNKDTNYLIARDLLTHKPNRRTSCQTYMIFTRDLAILKRLFNRGQSHLLPFTDIFLFVPSNIVLPYENILNALSHGYSIYGVKNSFFNTSYSYFNLNYGHLKNLYTNHTLLASEVSMDRIMEYFGTAATHPLFNKNIVKGRPFRIGIFNCPPYITIENSSTDK